MENNELIEIQNIYNLIKQKKNKLKKQAQLDFAYDYWHMTDKDIIDLYTYLAKNKSKENKKIARALGDFIDDQNITHYRTFGTSFYEKDEEIIENVTKRIKTNGNWLSLYDTEKEFTPRSTHSNPIRYSYLIGDNQKVSIDKETAHKILGILLENNVPTAKIIVTSSFPYYAKEDMDTYIKSFQKTK